MHWATRQGPREGPTHITAPSRSSHNLDAELFFSFARPLTTCPPFFLFFLILAMDSSNPVTWTWKSGCGQCRLISFDLGFRRPWRELRPSRSRGVSSWCHCSEPNFTAYHKSSCLSFLFDPKPRRLVRNFISNLPIVASPPSFQNQISLCVDGKPSFEGVAFSRAFVPSSSFFHVSKSMLREGSSFCATPLASLFLSGLVSWVAGFPRFSGTGLLAVPVCALMILQPPLYSVHWVCSNVQFSEPGS